ncbi:flippase-like domain-containing protein [bacterium]|nr:flippase-like domain-containing protein [bacterium]
MARERLRFGIRLLFTAATVAWFFSSVRMEEMIDGLSHVRWPVLAAALLIHAVWIVPAALRWKRITQICGYRLPFWTSLRYCFIGYFFSTFLPTGNGGDVVRGLMASKDLKLPLGGLYGTILVERIIGLWISLVLVLATGIAFFEHIAIPRPVLISAAVLFGTTLAAGGLIISRSFRGLIRRMLQAASLRRFHSGAQDAVHAFDACRKDFGGMALAGFLTLFSQFIQIASAYVLSLAIPDFRASFGVFFAVIPLTFISVLLPSIGGYGVREAGTVIFFGWFGVPGGPAAMFGILRLLFLWYIALAGGILYVLGRREKTGLREQDASGRESRPG